MKQTQIHEAENPYWGIASANFKEKHQTVEEWVHANVPKSYWEKALKWIEKHFIVEPTDNIDWLDKEQMEELKDDIMFFTSENSNRGQKMKWYRLYKESSDQDFVIKNGVLEKYTGRGGDIVIPKNVTIIGQGAFTDPDDLWKNPKITSVTIPNGVTSIEDEAFYYCRTLTSVTIPEGVTNIGKAAFCTCDKLKGVTIPNSVTRIGDFAFAFCKSITNVTIPSGVTTINDSVFEGCSQLTNVGIPNSVTSIGESAFSGCENLTSITIPEKVTNIEWAAFYDCENLRTIQVEGKTDEEAKDFLEGAVDDLSIVKGGNIR